MRSLPSPTQCDCAGATKANAYMKCVKRVVAGRIARQAAWLAPARVRSSQCEAEIGCGKGIRPLRTVQQVFTQSCALPSCHSSITRQGGLVLDTEDVSYRAWSAAPSHAEGRRGHDAGRARATRTTAS